MSPLLTLVEQLRPQLDEGQHAQLHYLAHEDQTLGVLEVLNLRERGRISLTEEEARSLRLLLEDETGFGDRDARG